MDGIATQAGMVGARSVAAAYRAAVLADSPVAYWRLGEPSGTTMEDETGVYDGTYIGSPTLGATGPMTGFTAVSLDGADDRGEVSDNAALRPANVTIEGWIYTDSGSSIGYLAAKRDNSDSNWGLYYDRTTSGKIGLNFFGGLESSRLVSGSVLSTGWHHVAGTITSAGAAVVYVDGASVISGTITAPNTSSSIDLVIGARRTMGAAVSALYNRRLAEVAIYSTALSSTRIAAHYAAAGY